MSNVDQLRSVLDTDRVYDIQFPGRVSSNGWKLSIQGKTLDDALELYDKLNSYLHINKISYKIATKKRINHTDKEQSKKIMTVYIPNEEDVKDIAEEVYKKIKDYKGWQNIKTPSGYEHYANGIFFRNDRNEIGEYIPAKMMREKTNFLKYHEYVVESAMVDHSVRELKLAGMMNKKSENGEYNQLVANAVIDLMKTFSGQGHSGFSAGMVRDIFAKLSNWETLTPITTDPNEWNDVSKFSDDKPGTIFQNKRNPAVFSYDGCKTWKSVDESILSLIEEDFIFLTESGILNEKSWDKEVKSSHLKEMRYDNKTEILEIDFLNGSTYRYKSIPEKVFRDLAEEQNILNKIGKGIVKGAKKLFGKKVEEGTFGTRFWELIRRGEYEYEKIK